MFFVNFSDTNINVLIVLNFYGYCICDCKIYKKNTLSNLMFTLV